MMSPTASPDTVKNKMNLNIIQGNAFVDCKVGVLTGGASTAVGIQDH